MLTKNNTRGLNANMFELTAELIQKYDQKYLQEINDLKKTSVDDITSQLENMDINDDLVAETCNFWDAYKETIEEFTELIYLMKQYINGNLYASYDNLGPMHANHSDSFETLKKLADLGVLTTNGQCSIQNQQKSYLDFYTFVPNQKTAVKLLSNLSLLGMNVSAITYDINDDNIVLEDLIYDDDNIINSKNIIIYKKLNIFDIEFKTFDKYKNIIPKEHALVSKPNSWCWYNNVCSMLNELDNFVNIKMPKGYTFLVATIHSQEWDDKQADKLLLNEIKKIKLL